MCGIAAISSGSGRVKKFRKARDRATIVRFELHPVDAVESARAA